MSKEISLEEVQKHNKSNDLWIIIENNIYNVTKFRNEHPGGEEVLIEAAGKDATKEFTEVGHSDEAKSMMKKYLIGKLSPADISKTSKDVKKEIAIAVGAIILGIGVVFIIKKVLLNQN